ncbi:MAG: hypothetical protein O2816_07055 [Planctomycetota bacterium]|nr:hypothetical protein [Planctomycetota bacterium]
MRIALLSLLVSLAPAQEKWLPRPGEVFEVAGRTAFVIEPKVRPEGAQPWVWYAPTLARYPGDTEGWMFDRFLAAGVAIAGIDVGESYGSPDGRAQFEALHEHLTSERGYASRPVLLARSRGGLMLYNWAVEHPGSVGAVAGIYPVCDVTRWPGDLARVAPAFGLSVGELEGSLAEHNPIERLAPLAKAGVPVFHIHGNQDRVVTLEGNSAELARRYKALGGDAVVRVIDGRGHDLWEGWFQHEELTDWVIDQARRAAAPPKLKVYLLAGQSNMVGMGTREARNTRHALFFTSEAEDAQQKLTVSAYEGAWSADTDYDALTPSAVATATMGGDDRFPDAEGDHVDIARGFLEVAKAGRYTFDPGYGHTIYNSMVLDGQEVYRRERGRERADREEITLEPGRRYPVTITFFGSGSAPFWIREEGLPGTLATLTAAGQFPHLVDANGEWAVRDDVHYHDARISKQGGPLSIGATFGPELGFGHVIGDAHDESVLLIKTAMGNRALAWDFRPPSSGKLPDIPDDLKKWEGLEYRLMIAGARETLANLETLLPGYQGQGYALAGFAWFQGHKDTGNAEWTATYEQNLVNLIDDLRAEFEAPDLPVVIATVGFEGHAMTGPTLAVHAAQMAVSGTSGKYPQYAGNVLSVDTRDFWRGVEVSPQNQGYHYNRNAETYLLVGEAIARAMLELEKNR